MDPALLKLMLLQARGMGRRVLRGAKTPRGVIFFALGLMVFGLWLASAAVSARLQRSDPEHVRAVAPLMLLGVCLLTVLTSAGDKAVAFTPGEVDFLFPGPFTRRQLLVYKLAKTSFAAALSAAVIAFALLRFATNWLACYVGLVLMLLLVQFLGMALMLVAQAVTERAWSRGRRALLLAVAAVAVIGLRQILSRYPLSGPNRVDVRELLQQFAVSDAGRVLLWPFSLFVRAMTAERVFPDLLKWASQAALIDLLLLVAVIKLDANYLEAAVGASQRRYERLRRVQAGGVMSLSARATARRRLPPLPFLFGAGPIAWRQLTHAARSARGLLVVLIVLAAVAGPFFVAARGSPGDAGGAERSLAAMLSTMAWFSILLASVLRFDFRADLDPMESLKTLPLRPWAVAAGQLVAPVLVMTAVHLVLLAAVAAALGLPPGHRPLLVVAAALALPFNLLLFASENLIFLLAPHRPAAAGPGDFQLLGKQIFTFAVRTLVVGVGGGVAAGVAVAVYLLGGRSVALSSAAAGAVLMTEGVALVPAVGWAFRRFDPSVHMPA